MRQTEVTVMFFSKKPKKISVETLIDLKQYIDRCTAADDAAVCEEAAPCAPSYTPPKESAAPPFFGAHAPSMQKRASEHAPLATSPCAAPRMRETGLADALKQMDESFSAALLRKIDEKHMTDAQCYKKAQIDRKLFSKIRSQKDYRPSKQTAISFALALELTPDETRDLLFKAGYALSHSNKADIIVEYFILHRIYDKFLVNEALYEFDQPLL